jgi:aspartyl-tRNA(Asn)/glutamyl-tRNA(Gln) amidotransferase subunit B
VRRLNLRQVSDRAALEPVARNAVAAQAKVVADFKRGKTQALQALKGAVMKEMRNANPTVVEDLLREIIAEQP